MLRRARLIPLLAALPLIALPLVALPLIASPRDAGAASFPCAKASTPTERAICADPALSSLDERLAATYREAIKAFGGTSPEDSKAGAAVKADQRAWLAARNACAADAACLRTAYERRLAVLGFRPDPAAPAATDRFVGRYDHRGFMEVSILGLRDGQAAVHLTGAHPGDGRWVCDFEGIGRPDAQGRLVVGAPDSDGNGLIILAKGDGGIQVPEIDVNLAASGNWCGAGGWFVLEYARKR